MAPAAPSTSGRGLEPQQAPCWVSHTRASLRRLARAPHRVGCGSSRRGQARPGEPQVLLVPPAALGQQQQAPQSITTTPSPTAAALHQRRPHRRPRVAARGALSDIPVRSVENFTDEPLSRELEEAAAQKRGGGGRATGPDTERVGVLLLNLGGPDTLDDVQPFLYNLFADPDIIRLPGALKLLQPFLALTLSTLRAPKSAEGYASIGGGSPLRAITQQQADALTDSLRAKGLPANVYVGMRYWHPYTEEALEQIKRDKVGRLVILPLYPQFSISTSGSSLRLLEGILKQDEQLRGLRHTVIPSWYQRAGYVRAMSDLICGELEKFAEPQSAELFFSAHGVPKSYVEEAGDPYKEEMEECISLIVSEVHRRGYTNHHTLAYQSRVGPVEWLQPYTDESIKELGASGVKSMLAVPVSFVSEHIETLEEIDMEYRELAEESGIKNWGRVPALNTNAIFIDDLADAVLEALPYVGQLAKPSDSLVPQGELEALLQAYDRERRALPSPVVMWQWGWTRSAETWNGRLAMVALFAIVLLELSTGRPILRTLLDLD